ncbi:hypothetical protein CBR_g48378 [Chara braunii]|nr:hypothetical protein CBR_g48378 [Chara braunii]|eukprot:GBG88760.1 hypothetical protein CBR_g48378 [Chara braunii]
MCPACWIPRERFVAKPRESIAGLSSSRKARLLKICESFLPRGCYGVPNIRRMAHHLKARGSDLPSIRHADGPA